MTRVLAFCDYFEKPMGGGAEIVSAEVYQRLAATGDFTVEVVSGVPGKPRPSSNDDFGPDVNVVRCRSLDLSSLFGVQLSLAPMLAIRAWRRIRKQRPDVIHASSIHFLGSLMAAMLATMCRIPMVTTCHLSGLEALPRRTRWPAWLHERIVGAFILRRSHQIIAVSESVGSHICSLGIDPAKVHVVENGVDVKRYKPGTPDPRYVTITYVGRLIANKGPLEVVEAFRALSGSHLRLQIVGDGPLASQVKKAAAPDTRISLLGYRRDVDQLLATSDIFVRLSTTEGRSLAVLEAMAAGCAVVLSDIAANAELVEDQRTGILVEVGDRAALQRVLGQLVVQHRRREDLAAAAHEEAEMSSWETASRLTGQFLQESAGR